MFVEIHIMDSLSEILGKICEAKVKGRLWGEGKFVIDLPKGADFLTIDQDWKITLVEAKKKYKKYTPNEDRARKLAESIGIEYETIVCDPFE